LASVVYKNFENGLIDTTFSFLLLVIQMKM